MGILITGAQMGNKGAQAMLFVTVNEIAKRFPEQEIYFATAEQYDETQFRFIKVTCSSITKRISALEGIKRLCYTGYAVVRDSVAFLAGRSRACWHYGDLLRLADQIDAIFDISGFALGNQWSKWSHTSYMDMIQFARRQGIPFYILPQSFGPFEYGAQKLHFQNTVERMNDLLHYPRIIYAREESSVEALSSIGIIENVRHSPDLVLQNREIDYSKIYKNVPNFSVPAFNGQKCVAVIPNKQCFTFGKKEELLSLYRVLIRKLNELGYKTVIMRHSREDNTICREIYNQVEQDIDVLLLDEDFSSAAFEQMIEQFAFAICSRYHGVVHAYKKQVPCIILGWADKYQAVSSIMGQNSFNFNIIDETFSAEKVLNALEMMADTFKVQKITIQNNLDRIQKESCFNFIEKDMRELGIQ